MADNYLERRMEDLRSGKSVGRYSAVSGRARRGGLHFQFPPKRILIASEDCRSLSIAEMFLKADCKVSIMSGNSEMGEIISKNEGIRFYDLSKIESTSNKDDIEGGILKHFDNLLSAWRDIDILISDIAYIHPLFHKWESHRERYPYVSDYKSRIFILSEKVGEEKESQLLSDRSFSVNTIEIKSQSKDLTGLIGMLLLPSNEFIQDMIFHIR